MKFPCVSLFCVLASLVLLEVAMGTKTCEQSVLGICLRNYVSGFSTSAPAGVALHCKLDNELAICSEMAIAKCGRTSTLLALGRAVLSYIAFDRKLNVCTYKGYWGLYQQLKTDDSLLDDLDQTSSWDYKIYTLLHQSQYSPCARRQDINCLKQFISKMKANPDVCTNIPFKYECIKEATKSCNAPILNDLLNVFPEESNKVLSLLCKPQDSG